MLSYIILHNIGKIMDVGGIDLGNRYNELTRPKLCSFKMQPLNTKYAKYPFSRAGSI